MAKGHKKKSRERGSEYSGKEVRTQPPNLQKRGNKPTGPGVTEFMRKPRGD